MEMTTTLTNLWKDSVDKYSDRPFLIFRDHGLGCLDNTWTYAEFDELASRTAGRLYELGIGHGDAIHMCLRNCPAFVMIWLAAARLGAWMIPVDPGSSSRDIDNQLRRTRPKLGICSCAGSDTYRAGVGNRDLPVIEVLETAADTDNGSGLLSEPAVHTEVSPADRMAIMFTSGTTSEPKGVVLTQANYGYIATKMAVIIGQKSQDRWYVCLPLFHGNAQYYCFLPAIASGASVALSSRFTASGWAADVHSLRATHASLFAAPIRMIIARKPADAPALKLQHVWFAQSLADKHFREFSKICGVLPRQLYGMTETTAIVTANLGPHPSPEAIGKVIPGRRIRLIDPATGLDTRHGEPGVICVKGTRGVDLFSEYLDNDSANKRAFPNIEEGKTWFFTGDLAKTRPDSTLQFVGRIDDVIKVSGENISLTEVEAAIAQAPNVLEAAVLAADDPIRDKVPVAYVVPQAKDSPPKESELSAWAESNLVPSARPRKWVIVDSLPRTSVGKIRRFKLAETGHQ
jgi:crotonobetaine/carnitine-CoA ligase